MGREEKKQETSGPAPRRSAAGSRTETGKAGIVALAIRRLRARAGAKRPRLAGLAARAVERPHVQRMLRIGPAGREPN